MLNADSNPQQRGSRYGSLLLSLAVLFCFGAGLFFPDLSEARGRGALPEMFQRFRAANGAELAPLETYSRSLRALRDSYLEEMPPDAEMTHAAIRGLLRSLDDPYTRFLDPEEYRQLREENQGEFVGIGAVLDGEPTEDGYVRINRPLPNTPAQAAGIQAGDLITHVDGESVVGGTVEDAVRKIRGQANTPVVLTISRPGVEEALTVRIVRQPVEYEVVEYTMKDEELGVGVITLSQFNEMADTKLERAVAELRERGMKGLVLDLRGNPGGMLEAAVDVASRFVPPDKTVVIIEESGGRSDPRRARQGKYLGGEVPLVILVNRSSASASEIVAAAVKTHGAGTIVGTTTFGKGLVQQVVPLTDNSALMVTTARYLSPDGTEINRGVEFRGGVEPDVEVEITEEDWAAGRDRQLEQAISILRDKIGDRRR